MSTLQTYRTVGVGVGMVCEDSVGCGWGMDDEWNRQGHSVARDAIGLPFSMWRGRLGLLFRIGTSGRVERERGKGA